MQKHYEIKVHRIQENKRISFLIDDQTNQEKYEKTIQSQRNKKKMKKKKK